ncbi:MAG: hypothetical protein DWQ40_13080 [Actinobacteria bacterium]|nr:MAG: hypothetical protein DWQ40_13080 [Actinomycetota bacterium]
MEADDAGDRLTPGLITRLQDIPGVEAVAVDLASGAGGINLRISREADESKVLQEVHELLVAYGVRGLVRPKVTLGQRHKAADPGIHVAISPLEEGARIQVTAGEVQSSRQVAATPAAIAQGLADAWSQVLGRIPQEVVSVIVSDTGGLTVVVSDGENERRGVGDVAEGWTNALILAVGSALGILGSDGAEQDDMARTAW